LKSAYLFLGLKSFDGFLGIWKHKKFVFRNLRIHKVGAGFKEVNTGSLVLSK
jgi:hypothetical protein